MRTTIRMNEGLARQVKQLAKAEDRTFTSLVEEAVTRLLSDRRRPQKPRKVVLPTFKGRGLQPGVNLDDTSALLDLMDADLPLEKRR